MDSFSTGQSEQKEPLNILRPKPVPRKRPPLNQPSHSTVTPTFNVDTVVQSRRLFYQEKKAQPLEDAHAISKIKVLQNFN